jgi:hypothetical protein
MRFLRRTHPWLGEAALSRGCLGPWKNFWWSLPDPDLISLLRARSVRGANNDYGRLGAFRGPEVGVKEIADGLDGGGGVRAAGRH